MKCKLINTCFACPEQYDLINIDTDEIVAYYRLRHSYFFVSVPDVSGEIIYHARTEGDGLFLNEAERFYHFSNALKALSEHYGKIQIVEIN